MKSPFILGVLFSFFVFKIQAQTAQDSLEIKRAALGYIESQHNVNPKQMQESLHPRLVKRSVFKDRTTQKEYISEYFTENMIILAEKYNAKGDKFPKNPKKEVKFLDVSEKTASVKLIADEWIDYMHIVKINNEWKIINVLWQYDDIKQHQ
jgi:hypothetical protein